MQEQIEAVQRMQEYIEANLSENITPADTIGGVLFLLSVFTGSVQIRRGVFL